MPKLTFRLTSLFAPRRLPVLGLIALLLIGASATWAFRPRPVAQTTPAPSQSSAQASPGALVQPTAAPTTAKTPAQPASSAPPPKGGYFATKPAGSWSSLPSGAQCAAQIHHSSWEPRPDNSKRNHTMPDPAAVHAAFAARPEGDGYSYNAKWDTWLRPRIDGQFTGTTDEIFQWAACKWGISDDFLRSTAVLESTWYQYETYPSGRCVSYYSCGDFFQTATPGTKAYCDYIDMFGHRYQSDYGSGKCPATFSIVGVKSYQDPDWGVMPNNQNGTFPFNRDSTAFAVEYYAAEMRGCMEGWESWLTTTKGDLMGCGGAWLSGSWYDSDAKKRVAELKTELATTRWLRSDWPRDKPACNSYGCPGPDKY